MNIKFTSKHLEIIKELSHEIWGSYDDSFGYRAEKQKINSGVGIDHPDNIWFFWNQFDAKNHKVLYEKLLSYVDCPERIDLIAFALNEIKKEQDSINELGIDL